MKRATPLVLVLSLLKCVSASADWSYARWGATPAELAKASGGAVTVLPPAQRKRHTDFSMHSETAAKGTYRDGDLQLALHFSFDLRSGGLDCIIFEAADGLPAAGRARMQQMFVKLYGKPLTHEKHESVGLETFSWSSGNDQIGLTLALGPQGSSFATQCVRGTIPPLD